MDSFYDSINAVVIGASGGIGSAFVDQLIATENVGKIFALSRSLKEFSSDKVITGKIDITDENSVQNAAAQCNEDIDLIIVATGMLHNGGSLPEKSLRNLDMQSMQECYAVNAFGPALVAKHFLPLVPKNKRSIFACLSARVASISDNSIGGWHSYRASKSALNMILKNTSIEVGRRYKEAIILGLHPGTVDTQLSKPFQSNVKHDIFTPKQAASMLLNVMNKAKVDDSGKVFDFDYREIKP
jgi:NAD(P)-dependent dehydrogenase (short-subunit alcohol dehydrogenase family)